MTEELLFYGCIVGGAGLLVFWLTRLLAGGKDDKLRERLRDPKAEAEEHASQPGISQVLKNIGEAASKPFTPTTREKQADLRRALAKAGIYSASAVRLMAGCKVIFLGAGIVGGYLIGVAMDNVALGASFGGIIGYLLPAFWLKSRIKRQQLALDRGLADAIDLMVVCVEAGLTVDSAMQRVGQEVTLAHPALAKEFEIAHMETRVGLSRADALKNLGQRSGCKALQSLAAMLIQAERFGTSIAHALRIHAESLRLERQHSAEEQAAKATVKLSFPVVLFIFPAVLIVLAGPAAIGLFRSALFSN